MKLQVFDPIYIETPKEKIYKRLGYHEGMTVLSYLERRETERLIDDALLYLNLRGVAGRIAIEEREASGIVLSGGVIFKGELVSAVFESCSELLCMGVTAGDNIGEAIHSYKDSDLTRSVVFDAVASECADACFDWIQTYFSRQLSREKRELITKRISCGYSDFSLEHQKSIYDLLELNRFGVRLTSEFVLVPEKSATAITGIRNNEV